MELLLNFIVWIRFFSWDQCCFNMRLIKAMMKLGSTQTFLDKHLALVAPLYPWPAQSAFPPSALRVKPYDPDVEKNHICKPHAANPHLYPKPKGIINCLGSRQLSTR